MRQVAGAPPASRDGPAILLIRIAPIFNTCVHASGDILFRAECEIEAVAEHMEQFEQEVVSDLDEQTDDRAQASRRVPLHVRILLGLLPAPCWAAPRARCSEPTRRSLASDHRQCRRAGGPAVSPLAADDGRPARRRRRSSSAWRASATFGVWGAWACARCGFCLVISLISVILGIFLANTVRPGLRLDPATRDLLMAEYAAQSKQVAPRRPRPTSRR